MKDISKTKQKLNMPNKNQLLSTAHFHDILNILHAPCLRKLCWS